MSMGIRETIPGSLEQVGSITEKVKLCVSVIGIESPVGKLAVILFRLAQTVKSSVWLCAITCEGNHGDIEQLQRLCNFPNKGVYLLSCTQSHTHTHTQTDRQIHTHMYMYTQTFQVAAEVMSNRNRYRGLEY